jgi:hypothetical protein
MERKKDQKYILSIDIGIKNLSMCIMSGCSGKFETYDIHMWDTFNTIGCDDDNAKCKSKQKNGKICGKKASYKNSTFEDIHTSKCDYFF